MRTSFLAWHTEATWSLKEAFFHTVLARRALGMVEIWSIHQHTDLVIHFWLVRRAVSSPNLHDPSWSGFIRLVVPGSGVKGL